MVGHFSLAAVMVSIFASLVAGQDKETGGALNGVVFNANAIRQFDLLLRLETLHDISAEEYFRDVTFYRIRADYDKGKFLCLRKSVRLTHLGPSRKEDGEKEQRMFAGIAASEGSVAVSPSPGIIHTHDDKFLLRELYGISVPDIRLVGLTQFPAYFERAQSENSFEVYSKAIAGFVFETTTLPDGEFLSKRILISPSQKSGSGSSTFLWHYSGLDNMPKSLEMRLKTSNSGRILYRNNFVWTERNSIYIPDSISGSRLGTVRATKEKKRQFYEVEMNSQFHWFLLNEEFADDAFSSSPLRSVAEFEKLVSPELSNASRILEVIDTVESKN